MKKIIMIIILILVILFCLYRFVFLKPEQNRNWRGDLKVLSHADINGNLVTVHDIRNFTYRTEDDYTPGYYDKTFDVSKLKKLYYAVVPFGSIPGIAHTFLSFEFSPMPGQTEDQFVAISIEVRKQEGESYSMLRSLVKPYELIYVVGDERDIIQLRTNHRDDEKTYLYPIKADQAAMQEIFLDYMNRINSLYTQPEFYNLFTSNCTTDIVAAVNRSTTYKIPWSYKILLPGFSDEYALEQGLIDTDVRTIQEARQKYYINDKSRALGDDPDFSVKIRQN